MTTEASRLRAWVGTAAVGFLVLSGLPSDAADDPGLVAQYTFEERVGKVAKDGSGNGNHGEIHGAAYVRVPERNGLALRFDGVDDFVDCGNDPALDLKEHVTVAAWVLAEAPGQGDAGIVAKEDYEAYALTLSNSRCWWYVSAGENHCMTDLGIGAWRHVVGTYDGSTSKLYIDGKLRKTRDLAVPIKSGGNLLIGALGKATGPSTFFKGMVDDVRVYSRALSAEEIRDRFEAGAAGMVAVRLPIKTGPTLRAGSFALRVGPRGGMQVKIGSDVYFVESSYSYPGKRIGYNHLSEGKSSDDRLWMSPVHALGKNIIRVTASGRFYSVMRTVKLKGRRVTISDKLTNRTDEDVGVIVRNVLIARERPVTCLLSGVPEAARDSAENPTVLLMQRSSGLGAVAEDNLSRSQFQAATVMNQADFRLGHVGLAPGKSVTLEWTLYPLSRGEDYWTFINRIREDWRANFRLIGPGDKYAITANPYWGTFTDKEKLRAYLRRTRLKVVSFAPFLDYDNQDLQTGKLVSRDEYKAIALKVMATVKAVDPSVRLVGSIEAPYVSLPRPLVEELYEKTIPKGAKSGFFTFTSEQMKIFQRSPEAWARWKEAVVWPADGRAKYEYYYRHGPTGLIPMIALTVYPAVGNGQHEYLMDQARFLIEDVGLDGIFIDSITVQNYSYDRWDGISVEIDLATGRITRKYTDCALAGVESRKILIEYGLRAGRIVLTNGHPIARDMQSLKALRFSEAEWYIDPFSWADGDKPPLIRELCKMQLGSPVSLGIRVHRLGDRGAQNLAKVVVKTAIAYLRHGILYFHFRSIIPETGPGSGGYGPFNHMYPITPVRLGEGFVEGTERIVTCVSGPFDWPNERAPKVLLFDITGRPRDHTMKPVRTEDGWRVDVALADWQEIAILEQ